jgi:hypothetical protein
MCLTNRFRTRDVVVIESPYCSLRHPNATKLLESQREYVQKQPGDNTDWLLDIHLRLARLYELQKEYVKAMKEYKRVIRLSPKHIPAVVELHRVARTHVYGNELEFSTELYSQL